MSHEVTPATSDITTVFFTVSVFTDIKIETFRMLLILYTTSQEFVTFRVSQPHESRHTFVMILSSLRQSDMQVLPTRGLFIFIRWDYLPFTYL